MGPSSRRPITRRRCRRGWVQCLWVGARNESPGGPVPDYQKEKEHELMREVRYSRAQVNARLGLWHQSPGEGLDFVSVRSCPWWEAAGWGGFFPCTFRSEILERWKLFYWVLAYSLLLNQFLGIEIRQHTHTAQPVQPQVQVLWTITFLATETFLREGADRSEISVASNSQS